MMKDERWMMKDDDFKLLKGFADEQTDKWTNEQTFVIVESLLRLKNATMYDFAFIKSLNYKIPLNSGKKKKTNDTHSGST